MAKHPITTPVAGHPKRVRPGQRYWPRTAQRREVFTVRSLAREGFAVCVKDSRRVVRVKTDRLLALRDDGEGRYYRWQGWAPRRSGYPTFGHVVAIDQAGVAIELPEWGRPMVLHLAARLIPAEARRDGASVRLCADLGATSAAALNAHDIVLDGGADPSAPRKSGVSAMRPYDGGLDG